MFGQFYQELVESSLEVCWKVYWEFTDRLSRARWKFARRMPESSSGVHRQVVGSSLRVHRRMLEVHRRKSGVRWGFT
ncbi:hypothetical protein B296_00007337 [Ensete ventricosum]|uniref:Uncharacterized protein n=1 Tax=Ensete ventricosum TaxID=4639 RepID=A0A426Z4K5_ENSVE|nr:hypothetical protein B296_00007337 [Ensete ventricosum]